MPYSKVIISIAYGKVDDAHVLNAVYIAVSKLKKLRIEPVIVQYYTPGLKLRIAVNGIELKVDEKLVDNIVSTALETVSNDLFNRDRVFVEGGFAAAYEIV